MEQPLRIAYDFVALAQGGLGRKIVSGGEQAVMGHGIQIISRRCVMQMCGHAGCFIGCGDDQRILCSSAAVLGLSSFLGLSGFGLLRFGGGAFTLLGSRTSAACK